MSSRFVPWVHDETWNVINNYEGLYVEALSYLKRYGVKCGSRLYHAEYGDTLSGYVGDKVSWTAVRYAFSEMATD